MKIEPSLETGEPEFPEYLPMENRIVEGSLWMLGITTVLFFLPVANGIIGGLVGGYRAGNAKSALLASILPAGGAAFLLWMLLAVAPLPIFGAALGAISLSVLIMLSCLGMLLGAAIGGTVAHNRINRLNRA